MGFKNIANKLSQSAQDYADKQKVLKQEREEEKERLVLAEQERKNRILNGDIQPINLFINLNQDEKPYAEFNAKRLAMVEEVVQHTTVKTKKKGVASRAIVGGVLLGPLGALGGAATAGSKGNSVTTQNVTQSVKAVDTGQLILTNQRVLFIGNNIVSIPYGNILAFSFESRLKGIELLTLKYPEMLPSESYAITGSTAKDAELYYMGITGQKNLAVNVTSPQTDKNKNKSSALKTAGKVYFAPYIYTYKAGKAIAKKGKKKQ
jgi:hypothetical protein